MKFQLRTILSSTALLLSAARADDVKLFTSDGVVYSYAVMTSTIAPPSVRVETHYYTTTRVREFTMADSEVRTTTENIVSASETTSPVESTYSSSTLTSTSSSSTQVTDSRSTSTLEPASVNSLTGSTSSSTPSSSTSGSSQLLSSTTSVTSTFSPTISPMSSTDRSSSSPTTVVGSDGKCSVYYDDDEYYSTVYLTEPNQSVDAATTITSTRVVYETLTLI